MIELPPEVKRGPKWLRNAFKEYRDFGRKIRVASLMGGTMNETPDGIAMQVSPGGALPSQPWHPYRVNAEDSLNDGTPQVSVEYNSDLWKDFGNKYPIVGLDEPFPVAMGDLIWLHIGIQDADHIVPAEASIEYGPDAWEGHPCPIVYYTDEDTGQVSQAEYNKIIAEVVDTDDTRDGLIIGSGDRAVKIIQHLKSALLCALWAVDGIVCLVPEETQL